MFLEGWKNELLPIHVIIIQKFVIINLENVIIYFFLDSHPCLFNNMPQTPIFLTLNFDI